MNEIEDFLAEAQAMQKVAFYSAEHERMANAQAYATIALAQAIIALVERIDFMATGIKLPTAPTPDDGLPF